MFRKNSAFILLLFCLPLFIYSQDKPTKDKNERHTFTMIYDVDVTPVKSQDRTGTCWCFSTESFLESELLRLGKGEYDLSEMFVVRNIYPEKAEKYVRYHGKYNFGPGGQAHDVWEIYKKYGIVPEEVYPGKIVDPEIHNHGEMDAVLKAELDAVLEGGGRRTVTGLWPELISKTLDVYLGDVPQSFVYDGEMYTPKSFAESLGLNPDDYVELTSYTHHPFYEKFILEVPDNWSMTAYYNLPLNELVEVMDNALENGFSVEWDGDSGRDNFYREGYAVIPVTDKEDENEDSKLEPEKEKVITQEVRQKAFNDFSVTDDHLMHVVGLAKDQAGTKFYYTKNSWGSEDKTYGGFWYMSEPYVRLKTIAVMVHKDAIPDEIRDKLGI